MVVGDIVRINIEDNLRVITGTLREISKRYLPDDLGDWKKLRASSGSSRRVLWELFQLSENINGENLLTNKIKTQRK